MTWGTQQVTGEITCNSVNFFLALSCVTHGTCSWSGIVSRNGAGVSCNDWQNAMNPVKYNPLRLLVLKELGFHSYDNYLKSGLWMGIRLKVLRSYNYRCCKCNQKATVIHHTSYDRSDLDGTNLANLYALCSNCHDIIHGKDPIPRRKQKPKVIPINENRRNNCAKVW